MSKVVIIGGGPAGCMAALTAKSNGHQVILLEKNSKIGKKLGITGKGRCNVTYNGDNQKFLENVVNNSKFLMSAINSFNNDDLLRYLKKIGVDTKLERGNRIFLKSDNALELVEKLNKELVKNNIDIRYNSNVKEILVKDDRIYAIKVDNFIIKCDSCIIATGGKSYPKTGSTGDGYEFARKLGHNIVKVRPALVPLKCYEIDTCKALQGLTLKNIKVKIIDINNVKKFLYKDFGEILFTHFGISGPTILSASSKINNMSDLDEKLKNHKLQCIIDLKPALTEEQLYKRISRDFEKYANKEYKNSLNDLLPKSIIPVIIKNTKIKEDKKVNQITKEEKNTLVKCIKKFTLYIKSLYDIEAGIVSAGGVDTKEINPKTMQSKLVNNLYFAGEIIDVDAYTGGYNLQIAFSTGYVAGINVI